MMIESNLVAEGTMKYLIKQIKKINEENLGELRIHNKGENNYELYVKNKENKK